MERLIFLLCILDATLVSFTLGERRLVDLSHAYDESTIMWPGGQQFRFTKQYADVREDGWYSANDFTVAEHGGTHLDAPYHFTKEGITVESIPLENLFVNGVYINVSHEITESSPYVMPVEPLKKWEELNGPIPERSVILIGFGWASKWPNMVDYLGPSKNDFIFPGVSEEATQWILNTNKVVGVGVDTASPDNPGSGLNFPVHRLLSDGGLYILENVAILEPLPPKFKLIILPMKIKRGTGAPARIVAVLD